MATSRYATLAGNADILLYAARRCGPPSELVEGISGAEVDADLIGVVDRVALRCRSLCLRRAALWPDGGHTGETPALMVGLAGVGLFYLRRNDARIPSILVLEPERIGERLDGGR